MKNRFLLLVLALLLALSLMVSGCGVPSNNPATNEPESSVSDDGTLKIAAVMKNRSNPYYLTMEEGFKRAASDFGVDVEIFALDSDSDLDKEIELCNDILNKDYDGIVLIPINGAAFGPVVKKFNEKEIPVVNIDTQFDQASLDEVGATYVTYVGSDDYSAGVLAAEVLNEKLGGTGKVAVIEGTAGSSTAEQRKLGFQEKIEELNADGSSIEIVASQTANWDTNEAYNVFQNIIQANQDLNAVFASNDLMAIGVINAAEAAGKLEQLTILGIDCIPDAQALVKEGKMLGSISQAPDAMAYIGVEKLLAHINGEDVDAEYRTDSIMCYAEDFE